MIYPPESPAKFFLGASTGGDVNGQEEFFEVNIAVIVLVEVPEDIVTELLRVGRHEA